MSDEAKGPPNVEDASRLEPKNTTNVFQLVAPAVDLFVDGVASMMASGGVVRISLMQVVATPFEGAKGERRVVANLFIPIDGYVKIGEYINQSIKDMIEKGFLTYDNKAE